MALSLLRCPLFSQYQQFFPMIESWIISSVKVLHSDLNFTDIRCDLYYDHYLIGRNQHTQEIAHGIGSDTRLLFISTQCYCSNFPFTQPAHCCMFVLSHCIVELKTRAKSEMQLPLISFISTSFLTYILWFLFPDRGLRASCRPKKLPVRSWYVCLLEYLSFTINGIALVVSLSSIVPPISSVSRFSKDLTLKLSHFLVIHRDTVRPHWVDRLPPRFTGYRDTVRPISSFHRISSWSAPSTRFTWPFSPVLHRSCFEPRETAVPPFPREDSAHTHCRRRTAAFYRKDTRCLHCLQSPSSSATSSLHAVSHSILLNNIISKFQNEQSGFYPCTLAQSDLFAQIVIWWMMVMSRLLMWCYWWCLCWNWWLCTVWCLKL